LQAQQRQLPGAGTDAGVVSMSFMGFFLVVGDAADRRRTQAGPCPRVKVNAPRA